MKKIAGFIILLGGIALLIIDVYEFFRTIRSEYFTDSDKEYILLLIFYLAPIAACIYYPIATKFGDTKSKNLVLENLDKENEIIKRQIEKRELLSKLETLEKK